MRLGKNKKKQWRRCAPGIEEEIIKSKEIDEGSFEVRLKSNLKELKYSTVPRIITKKVRKFVKNEAIDLWAEENNVPNVLSKRQKSSMENKSKYVKPVEIIHPGTSWFPEKTEHAKLLEMLEKDESSRILANKKFTMKVVDEIETKTIENECSDEEVEMEEESLKTGEKKRKTTKERKRKLRKMNLEAVKQKERSKQKGEAHGLRNIPKFCKEIKRTKEEQRRKLEAASELKQQQEADKIFKDQIHRMPFQLPSELAANLRSMQSEGDLMRELCDKVKAHKFKAEKPRKMRKTKRMVKKRGLV